MTTLSHHHYSLVNSPHYVMLARHFAIWEAIFDWFSKYNVIMNLSINIYLKNIFIIYIFRTVVVQYFTRREERDRDDPFWHTGTGWQLDHSQDDLGLIELQFPFRCSQHSDQFKIRGELTNRLNEDSDYVYQEWELRMFHPFLLQCQGFSLATICLFFSQ